MHIHHSSFFILPSSQLTLHRFCCINLLNAQPNCDELMSLRIILNYELWIIFPSSLFILHFIKYYYHFRSFPFVASGQKCAMFFRIKPIPKNIKNTWPMRLQPCGTAIWAYRLRDRTFVASWLEFNRSGVWYLIVDDKNRIVKSYLLKLWLSTHYELSQISRISNRWILIFKFAEYRAVFVRKNISICCLRIPLRHLLMRTKLHGWTMIHFS